MVAQLGGISVVMRTVLVLVFGAAALGKARNLHGFTNTLLNLGLPASVARLAAPVVIGYEAGLAVMFATGVYSVVATMLALCLLLAFLIVSLVAHVSHRTVACNCFGAGDSTLGLSTIARSGLLMIPAVGYMWLPPFNQAGLARPLETSTVLAALTVGFILLGKWILAFPQVVKLIGSRRRVEQFLVPDGQLAERSSEG